MDFRRGLATHPGHLYGGYYATFEGNGYTISNLYINRPEEDSIGFFRRLGDDGTIRNLGLLDVDIKGRRFVGALAANLGGTKPSISHSHVTGSVSGFRDVGGLAGLVHGSGVNISDTRFTGAVSSLEAINGASIGGLVGRYDVGSGGYPGSIRRSHTAGTVTARGSWCSVGGLVGQSEANVIASSSSADVNCLEADSAGHAGGLLGSHSDAVLKSSFATGDVRAARSAGGLVGFNVPSAAHIVGSYATGDVTALAGYPPTQFGGLVGQQHGIVRSSYATGSVSGPSGPSQRGGLIGLNGPVHGHVWNSFSIGHVSGDFAGGLVGRVSSGSSFSETYWNTETSGLDYGAGRPPWDGHEFEPDPSGVAGKTTAELQAPTGYTGIYQNWNPYGEDLWDFGARSQYPVLKADMNGDGVATWQEFGSQRGNEPSTQRLTSEQPCDRTITGDGSYTGVWTGDCVSSEAFSRGTHARYYTFTLERGGEVTIQLESEADAVLYLRQGEGRNGRILYANDDANLSMGSRISENLPKWTFTIEATTYHAGDVGPFRLTVTGLGEATPPVAADCLETVAADGTVSGEWGSGCQSANRLGSYARYYTFTLGDSREVAITLESSDADTFLNLLSGAGRDGSVLHYNDDHEGSTSRSLIRETLEAGSYTVEATTYDAGETGGFTLTISGLGMTRRCRLALTAWRRWRRTVRSAGSGVPAASQRTGWAATRGTTPSPWRTVGRWLSPWSLPTRTPT